MAASILFGFYLGVFEAFSDEPHVNPPFKKTALRDVPLMDVMDEYRQFQKLYDSLTPKMLGWSKSGCPELVRGDKKREFLFREYEKRFQVFSVESGDIVTDLKKLENMLNQFQSPVMRFMASEASKDLIKVLEYKKSCMVSNKIGFGIENRKGEVGLTQKADLMEKACGHLRAVQWHPSENESEKTSAELENVMSENERGIISFSNGIESVLNKLKVVLKRDYQSRNDQSELFQELQGKKIASLLHTYYSSRKALLIDFDFHSLLEKVGCPSPSADDESEFLTPLFKPEVLGESENLASRYDMARNEFNDLSKAYARYRYGVENLLHLYEETKKFSPLYDTSTSLQGFTLFYKTPGFAEFQNYLKKRQPKPLNDVQNPYPEEVSEVLKKQSSILESFQPLLEEEIKEFSTQHGEIFRGFAYQKYISYGLVPIPQEEIEASYPSPSYKKAIEHPRYQQAVKLSSEYQKELKSVLNLAQKLRSEFNEVSSQFYSHFPEFRESKINLYLLEKIFEGVTPNDPMQFEQIGFEFPGLEIFPNWILAYRVKIAAELKKTCAYKITQAKSAGDPAILEWLRERELASLVLSRKPYLSERACRVLKHEQVSERRTGWVTAGTSVVLVTGGFFTAPIFPPLSAALFGLDLAMNTSQVIDHWEKVIRDEEKWKLGLLDIGLVQSDESAALVRTLFLLADVAVDVPGMIQSLKFFRASRTLKELDLGLTAEQKAIILKLTPEQFAALHKWTQKSLLAKAKALRFWSALKEYRSMSKVWDKLWENLTGALKLDPGKFEGFVQQFTEAIAKGEKIDLEKVTENEAKAALIEVMSRMKVENPFRGVFVYKDYTWAVGRAEKRFLGESGLGLVEALKKPSEEELASWFFRTWTQRMRELRQKNILEVLSKWNPKEKYAETQMREVFSELFREANPTYKNLPGWLGKSLPWQKIEDTFVRNNFLTAMDKLGFLKKSGAFEAFQLSLKKYAKYIPLSSSPFLRKHSIQILVAVAVASWMDYQSAFHKAVENGIDEFEIKMDEFDKWIKETLNGAAIVYCVENYQYDEQVACVLGYDYVNSGMRMEKNSDLIDVCEGMFERHYEYFTLFKDALPSELRERVFTELSLQGRIEACVVGLKQGVLAGQKK